jgi:uncharacterized Ntn-hydrolase superfamily protein
MSRHDPSARTRAARDLGLATAVVACLALQPAGRGLPSVLAQEPAAWGAEPLFHTFSIVAVDPETGETGVAVTTRNTCVGNGVPWVRAGVGAVATQAATRVQYGEELLDLLEAGLTPDEALARALAGDQAAARRQVGVVDAQGRTARHTGTETNPWSGDRAGQGFTVQGNLLVGAGVLDAVVADFEATLGSDRHLADRLVAALEAGQRAGGDARRGRLQSAAVMVADPRPDMATRPDGQTVFIHVCEHPEPVLELRRVYDTTAGVLGHRVLEQQGGRDIAQLQIMLTALGYLTAEDDSGRPAEPSGLYDAATVDAVERFRGDRGLSTANRGSPRGLVDPETVGHLWSALDERELAADVRARIRAYTLIRR